MKFPIKSRVTGQAIYKAELGAEFEGASYSVQLGAAVKIALKAHAYLAHAYLTGADLTGANLAGADLAGANLAGAYLGRAEGIISAGTPDRWHCYGWLRTGYLSIRVGCREKRLDEARAYWAGKDDRREVLAAVEYIAAVAEIRGWPTAAEKKGKAA